MGDRRVSQRRDDFAIGLREVRAGQLARIGAARAGHAEPRLAAWLGEEVRRASESVLQAWQRCCAARRDPRRLRIGTLAGYRTAGEDARCP